MTCIKYQEINLRPASLEIVDKANEIIEEFEADNFVLTLRQLYYQFVAKGLIENSERSYKRLGSIISDARVAGLISWEAIEDRGRACSVYYFEEDDAEIVSGLEYGLNVDFWARQENYVEIWVEKEALFGVIERTAERRLIPHLACKGYLSASEAWRAGRRFATKARQGFNCVLIHLGDHDPSGIDMTRDNAARLELFAPLANVEVRRIALNMDQVQQYKPPPNPAKITDSRAADYIKRFGKKSWELDALSPAVIDKLIQRELDELIDMDQWRACEKLQDEKRSYLRGVYDYWDQIKALIDEERDA